MTAIFPSDRNLQLSDITTNNATSSKHGLLPKLSGSATDVLTGAGTFVANSSTIIPATCNGRLTLESGVPYSPTDQTGKTSVFFTPLNGAYIALYSGSAWSYVAFTEKTLALGTLINAMGYDIFGYDSGGGVLALESLEWQNATVTMTLATPCVVTWTTHGLASGNSITFTNSGGALPANVAANTQYWVTVTGANTFNLSTSPANREAGTLITTNGQSQSGTHTGHSPTARQTALTTQDGVYVKSGDTTRRYLGSFMTTATTTTEDSKAKRFVWNLYNNKQRTVRVIEATNTWTYNTDAWHQVNASTANQIAVFAGLAISEMDLFAAGLSSATAATTDCTGIGENLTATNAPEALSSGGTGSSTVFDPSFAKFNKVAAIGYQFYAWLERGAAVATTTWYGDNGATRIQTGMSGTWEC